MNRFVAALAAALLPICASAAPTKAAALKAYVVRAMPKCPDAKIALEPIDRRGPIGFIPFTLTLSSSDKTCGKQTALLYSPSTQQVLIGAVFLLPPDNRNVAARVTEAIGELLKTQLTATVSPIILPDRLREVAMTKQTSYGPFSYHGFVDASERFLIVGTRGTLGVDPAQTISESIGVGNAVRRGNPKAKVEVIELSDFQCPSCGRAHKEIEPFIAKHLGKINYARLDLPLFEHHPWSIPAALGARAIHRVAPAKYWSYVNFIFENQETIDKAPSFDTVLQNFCEDHDIDWKSVETIYRSPEERNALLEQVSRMFDNGIVSTPTYIINGQIMGFGPDGKFAIKALKQAIGAK